MATIQRNANKRFSGIYDSQSISSTTFAGVDSGLVRRTSKRSSNKDRKGQVFVDDEQQAASSGQVTPDSTTTTLATREDPSSSSLQTLPSSASRNQVLRTESARDRIGQNTDGKPRPRTRTLDERARKSSFENKIRNRVGSVAATQPMPTEPDSSIGYPSAVTTSPATLQKRPPVKPPSRPLSPMNTTDTPIIPGLPSPNNDIERMISLMKTTAGRMHGILFFRRTRSESWSSGYCAINVASGTLIYQMKGDVSQGKPLIPDLRGCTVRTELDPETNSHFVEIASRTSDFVVHLKPHVPETIESWLAALLCWQPLVPRSIGATASIDATIAAKPIVRQSIVSPRRNSVVNLLREAAIIKVGKMLFWDRDVPPPHLANSTQRISTYRQQRSASGTSWRKVSCTLQENGLLKMYGDPETTLLHQIPLSALRRCAIQRLHPTVMEDEYCLAIYPQYRASNTTALALSHPIFLSFETRILFEVWFVLLRAFTTAELCGPEQPSVRASIDLSISDPKLNVLSFDKLFRIERVLALRIIEAKIFSVPQENVDAEEGLKGRTRGNATAELAVGDYHAEARIDGEIRGRAAVRTNTGNPFWREDYDFYDLSSVIKSAVISIKSRSRGQKDWVVVPDAKLVSSASETESLGHISDLRISPLNAVVGSIDLPLESLDRGKDSEQWWNLTNEDNEVVGEILLKIRIDEAVVLVAKHYAPVFEMLCKFATGLTQQIAFAVPTEFNKLHEILLNIFQYSNQASNWLMSLVEDEIDGIHKDAPAPRYRYSRRIASNDAHEMSVDREWTLRDAGKNATQEANLLFRGNSLLTKALDLHMRRLGKEFLEETLGERIRDIDESDPDCEVDPNRIRQNDDLPRNWRNLIALTESVWIAIKTTLGRCPPELRAIFRHIRACADDRYGAFLRNIKYSSVSGFLFLRFFCPAVLNPKLFGLLKDHPRPRAMRTLTFIAKSLQCLANLSTFGNKEPWMEPMNQFISTHRQEFKDYIDQICTISTDQASRIPPSYATPQTILSRLPATAKEGFPSLPHLIDQARELATLTNGWIEATGDNRPTVQDGEDIAAFDRLCYIIREQTSSTINCAPRAEPNGAVEGNLERVAETYDRRTRSSLYRSPDSGSLVSRSNPVSPRSATSAFARQLRDIHQTGISEGYQSNSSRNSSQVSLQSDYNGQQSQGQSQPDTGGHPSPPLLSPTLSATLSPTSWDASETEGGERFPSHAISWEKSGVEKRRGEHNSMGEAEGSPRGIRQDQARSQRHKDVETYANATDVAESESAGNTQPPFTMATSTYDDRNSTSPREGGRKFTDVWNFRRKDREKYRSEAGSDIAARRERPALTIDKRGTLTKKDREREKREREKDVRVLLENPKALREGKDTESKGKGQVKK